MPAPAAPAPLAAAPPAPTIPGMPPGMAVPAAGVVGGINLDEMMRQGSALSADFRQHGMSAGHMADLANYGFGAQAQAQAQMAAFQQASSGGGGIGAIMSALGMQYSSDYVKRVDCPTCGAPKKLPSSSAYLYCDYCASLADYDFRRACEDSGSLTAGAAQFAQTINSTNAEAKAALEAGDKDAYRAAQAKIWDATVNYQAKAYSHRLGDPEYKAQFIRYMTETAVIQNFDPQFVAIKDEMRAKAAGLEYTGSLMDRRTGGPTFRAMVEVTKRQAARANELALANNLIELDPDHASEGVRERMAGSLFSQGWLPMLNQDDAAWLIDELHIGGEYIKAETAEGAESRNCGGCGGTLTVLPGAKTVICDHCGRSLDVGGAQLQCRNCGGSMSLPVGVQRQNCPFCSAEVERVGWT
jgi:hypothetical protein